MACQPGSGTRWQRATPRSAKSPATETVDFRHTDNPHFVVSEFSVLPPLPSPIRELFVHYRYRCGLPSSHMLTKSEKNSILFPVVSIPHRLLHQTHRRHHDHPRQVDGAGESMGFSGDLSSHCPSFRAADLAREELPRETDFRSAEWRSARKSSRKPETGIQRQHPGTSDPQRVLLVFTQEKARRKTEERCMRNSQLRDCPHRSLFTGFYSVCLILTPKIFRLQ